MTDEYDDIINLPHHTSPTRPRMAIIDRAAQFAPFAALTGYDSAIDETSRLTDQQSELSDSEKRQLDTNLLILSQRIKEHPMVEIEYFRPDKRKSGGAYISVSAKIKDIDTTRRTITLVDRTVIDFDAISKIELK